MRRVATVTGALLLATSPARAADEDILLEFHYKPVPNAQIAVWLEDTEGNFVADVSVTQATGTLGIGNRPGRPDFLSSWRFPYGPRPGVLPVWAHARGKTYPKLVFHDDDVSDLNSLGWHENTSSIEPFFCRPLTPTEHENVAYDTMTCPSPSTFQSDKGRFSDETSVYPPRSDLTAFETNQDHPDVRAFSAMNDLDAVTRATPPGDRPDMLTAVVSESQARGPLVAWLEINLENDQSPEWTFTREDHYIDPRLSAYGIPYLGQPSVVYRVEFDPRVRGFTTTPSYAGYGDLEGTSGELHPPDATIASAPGTGAGRLLDHTLADRTFRFGVYSHGPGDLPPDDDWEGCESMLLPDMADFELEPLDFDRVRVHFTVPDLGSSTELSRVRLFYRVAADDMLTEENASTAIQQVPTETQCSGELEIGEASWCDVEQLFGSTSYQIGLRYEDDCNNRSPLVADAVTTPQQKFATVEGLCFVATAAYGAPWALRVQALRWFRDLYLKTNPVGSALVRFYYATSPPLAQLLAGSPAARSIARATLAPLTDLALHLTHYGRLPRRASPPAP